MEKQVKYVDLNFEPKHSLILFYSSSFYTLLYSLMSSFEDLASDLTLTIYELKSKKEKLKKEIDED